MYECAQRLKRETNGIESLKRQEKCLLACMNLLKLVDKKFAWLAVVVNPLNLASASSAASIENRFRIANNLMSFTSTSVDNVPSGELGDANLNVEIVDYDEINRNYMLVHYMIKLSSMMSNQSSIGMHICLTKKKKEYNFIV